MDKENKLLAGAASRDITPNEELMPIPFIGPVCMAKAADRLKVRVLCLECGEEKVLFVNFDMPEVPYVPKTMSFLQNLTGLDQSHIFTAAIHTHGAPFIGWPILPTTEETEKIYRRWYSDIMDMTKEAVLEAISSKHPAKLGYGEGKSYINVNRDEKVDGKYLYGNNYERPSDKTLRLVRLENEKGEMIALMVNFAVHGVVVNGCMIGDDLWLSGDLPGRTESILEEKLGGPVFWTSGAAGDQNPRVITNFGYVEGSNRIRTKSLGETGYMILDSLSEEHARDILKANEKLLCNEEVFSISAAEKDVLIRKKGSSEGDAPTVPFTLKILRIGNLVVEGVSAEVVTTVGKKLCDLSDAEHTIMVTHMQGSNWYIPDDWEYEENALVTEETLVEKGCALPVLTDAFREMLEDTKR